MKLLACHGDPYRRTLDTAVLDCVPRGDRYLVELAESVLFPGGGGQPADHGTIGEARVLDAEQGGGQVRYIVDRRVEPGPTTVAVDWDRRFDHMQQHTAQHLITCLAARGLAWRTLAFHLNPERCDIVFARVPDAAGIARLEKLVNTVIREARPVRHRMIEPEELARLGVRSRLLPAGHTGPLRVVEIEGYDLNTCAGTHVTNTAELQAVQFVGLDVQRGTGRLHWLAGGRLLADAARARARTEALNRVLCRGPAEHVAVAEGMVEEVKQARRALEAVERELAGNLGRQLAATEGPVATLHRSSADLPLLGAVAKAAARVRPDLHLLLTAGEPEGVFLVYGPEAAERGPAVAAILDGRGGGRGRRYQGKAAATHRRAEAAAALGAPS